jgi:hypothetical protein
MVDSQTSEVVEYLAPVIRKRLNFACWWIFKDEELLIRQFLWETKNANVKGSWKLKVHILFHGDNSWTAALTEIKFDTVKDHGHTCMFYWNNYFVWWSFKCGDREKFLGYVVTNSEYDVQNCLLGWWRQYAPLKRRSTIILHGSISQKTILNIILAAVRTWNVTKSE